jgi:hypothetical protein
MSCNNLLGLVKYGVSTKVVQQKTFVHNTSAVNVARVASDMPVSD